MRNNREFPHIFKPRKFDLPISRKNVTVSKCANKNRRFDVLFLLFFQNVSFRYNESTPYIYKNLEFGLDLDSRLALVGPNGAGKSTLLKLVYGELVPSEGKSQCGKTRILLSLEIFLISHNFLIFLRYGSTKQPFENRQIPPTFTRIIGHGFITFGLHDEKIP